MQSDNSVNGVGRGGRRADVPFLPTGLAGGAKRGPRPGGEGGDGCSPMTAWTARGGEAG